MKKIWKNKAFRICVTAVLVIVAILLAFRVPTRISAAEFNQHTDLPIRLLEKGADWSSYTVMGGFGMNVFLREGETGSLEYQVSNWPDVIFGSQCVDYIICRDTSVTICGLSVGDDIQHAKSAMTQLGFIPTRNDDQYERFGVIVTFRTASGSNAISEIVIAVNGTNILGVVF